MFADQTRVAIKKIESHLRGLIVRHALVSIVPDWKSVIVTQESTERLVDFCQKLSTYLRSRHACSRTDATLFWTCIKIAKALRDGAQSETQNLHANATTEEVINQSSAQLM